MGRGGLPCPLSALPARSPHSFHTASPRALPVRRHRHACPAHTHRRTATTLTAAPPSHSPFLFVLSPSRLCVGTNHGYRTYDCESFSLLYDRQGDGTSIVEMLFRTSL